MAFNIGDVVAKIKADTTDFQNGIQKVSNQGNAFGGVMAKVGKIAVAAFAVDQVIKFGKEILTQAGNFEQYRMSFEVMLGSLEKANVLMGQLTEFAKKTPFRLEEIVTGSKQLLAYGFAQEDIVTNMKMLGNVSSALKIPLGDLVYLYGTTATQGKAMTKDLYQFMNRGIPIVDMLAERFGVAKDKIFDMASESKISFKDIEYAMNSLGGEQGKWANLMDKQSGTMLGKLSNLQDGWQQLMVTLGNFFLPIATKVVDFLVLIVNGLQSVFSNVEGTNGIMVEMQRIWGEVLMFLQPLIDWFVASVVPLLQSIWAEFTYFINMIVPPVIKVWMYLVQVIIANLLVLVNWWKTHWDSISFILKSAWEFITGIIKIAVALILGIITVFLNLLTGNWQGAWDAIKHYSGMAWNGLKSLFNSIVDFIRGWGGLIIDALTSPFRRAWDTIKGIVEQIKSALDFTKRHSPSVVDIVTRGVKLVNGALDNLTVGLNPIDTSKLAFAGSGINGMSVNVDLSGAYIGDDSIGEKIGDAIISKLQKNVRF